MVCTMTSHVLGGIGHFDVAGPEIEPLASFYESVLGWRVASMGPGYAQVHTPEGAVQGALVEAPEASLTNNGFVVEAQVADPAGNRVTLIQG